jgi:serine/threonine protein kinase
MIVYDTTRQIYRVCDTGDRILATVSHDVWAFGCVMYNLCTGVPLFLSNDEDNLSSQKDLAILKNWNQEHLVEALDKIPDLEVRYFLSLLLASSPKHRLSSMEHVLKQAFLTNKSPGRLPGAKTADFDVFLSYRVDSDILMAQDLYHVLTAKGLRVWWDRKSLADGIDWEKGFCVGLLSSRIFVPLLSEQGIQERFSRLTEDSRCDNVYLENRLALELKDRGLTEKIFPIFVGAKHTVQNQDFYDKFYPGPVSNKCVHSVESKVLSHLIESGEGLPLRPKSTTVKSVMDEICKCNGGFVMSVDEMDKDERIRPLDLILDILANRIKELADDNNSNKLGIMGKT